jgi:prevent-host-death family protein
MVVASRYTTYEAKAKFAEVLRKVRRGQRVVISYRGREIAEIRPLEQGGSVGDLLRRHEERGTVEPASEPTGPLRAVARRRGALARFLESRD